MPFLPAARKQFAYYRHLGDGALAQLADDELHWEPAPGANSAATIVKHLAGNMHSRWTDFLATDGEKPSRDREGEFTADAAEGAVVRMRWTRGWAILEGALAPLSEADLARTVLIRNQAHTVQEALLRQLSHYPYHVGQLVYVAKVLRGDAWRSLSIPRGGSEAYNAQRFAGPRAGGHFTDEWVGGGERGEGDHGPLR